MHKANRMTIFIAGRLIAEPPRLHRSSLHICCVYLPALSNYTFRNARLKINISKQAYDEYAKRLRPVLALDTQWHKTDDDLEAAVRKDPGVVVRGKLHSKRSCDGKYSWWKELSKA